MEAALSRAVPNTDGRVMMEFAMDWLAKAGYLTVAQNLFFWGKRLRYLVSTMHDYRAGHGRAFDNIEVARSWLSAHPNCTGNVECDVFKVVFGAGFHEPSANDARARILRFFERHLQ